MASRVCSQIVSSQLLPGVKRAVRLDWAACRRAAEQRFSAD